MTKIEWDKVGERFFETGVDHGVLYLMENGLYVNGVAWNGLTAINETPSGAEATPQYADNIKYLNLISAEDFGATVEAFTYPDEFEQCDGSASPVPGISVSQQRRRPFGLAYRTLIGNDTEGTDLGYKLHLVYGAQAAPSEKSRSTVNDTPEAVTLSWELTTTPVNVPGLRPTAHLTIDSRKVTAAVLQQLEEILFGTESSEPRLPLPEEVISLVEGTVLTATATQPAFANGDEITIPNIAGVDYRINGQIQDPGVVTITEDTLVKATPKQGYKLAPGDDDWYYEFSAV